MQRTRRAALLLAVTLLLGLVAPAPADEVPVDRWGDPAPAIGRLGDVARAALLVVDPRRERAAAALDPVGDAKSSVLRVTTAEGAADLEVNGTVRDLAFAPAGDALHVVVHRPARRKGQGRTYHLRVEIPAMRPSRPLSLPNSARGLEVEAGSGVLLVACDDEVRSFRLDGLLSGPLYRIPGENRVVAAVPGSSRLLVGQATRVVEVDRAAPQGREGLEAVRVFPVPSSPVAFRPSGDGRGMEVLLEDGSIIPLPAIAPPPGPPVETAAAEPEPPARAAARRQRPRDEGDAGAPANRAVEPERPMPSAPAPLPSSRSAPAQEEREETVSPPARSAEARNVEPPALEDDLGLPGSPAPPAKPAIDPAPRRDAPETGPPRVAPVPEAGVLDGVVRGRPEGLAIEAVLYGPDNLTREAARATIDDAGRWKASGLDGGRYRVVLAAAGDVVLVTRPPFVTVEVGGSRSGPAAPIEIIRVVAP